MIHEVQQGSPEWLALRAKHFTASEAPAMLGVSKYQSRTDLLRQKALGTEPTVDAGTQARFDAGHAAEATAREMAEDILGEELYPATVTNTVDGVPLLASLDGLTMDESTVWEHKLWSESLAKQIAAGELDQMYTAQIEQQLLVTGAGKCLFMASDGTAAKYAWMWYHPNQKLRAEVITGWKQFRAELADYRPTEPLNVLQAAAIDDLPVLAIQISGTVTASNLVPWREAVVARIAAINTDLQTDQDFADADHMVKFLDDGEKRLDLVKSQAQAQAADIDAVFRAIDQIKAEMRTKRLTLDKLVKARKDSIRVEIMQAAQANLAEHVATLNAAIGHHFMPAQQADFAGAMRGKKSISSLRDAVDTELARAKIAASEVATRIQINVKDFAHHREDYGYLFTDLAQLVLKSPDDFANAVIARINEHKAKEAAKLEAQRERIHAEERARIEHEQVEAAMVPMPVAAKDEPSASVQTDTDARIKLGDINAAIAPLTITADGLAQIGFPHVGNERAAKLYRAADFPAIRAKLASLVQRATIEQRIAA